MVTLRGAVVLLALVAAACASTEVAEVEEQLVAPGDVANGEAEAKKPDTGVDFSDNVPAPLDVSAQVEKEELELARKERKAPPKSVDYFKIPNMRFSYQAKEIPGISTFGGCKSKCDGEKKNCKSFSFNEAMGVCLWSPESFGFDVSWTYYAKEPKGEYETIPGMKFESVEGKILKKITRTACKTECTSDPKCLGYGWSPEIKTCGLTYNGAEYDTAFNFYLKPVDPAEDGNTMRIVAAQRLPELKLDAKAQELGRHNMRQAESDEKSLVAKNNEAAKKTSYLFNEKAVKEPKAKIEVRERHDKEFKYKSTQQLKITEEKTSKEAESLKKAQEDNDAAAAKAKSAETTFKASEAEAEKAKTDFQDLDKELKQAKADLESAKASNAPEAELVKLKEKIRTLFTRKEIYAATLDTKIKTAEQMSAANDEKAAAHKLTAEKAVKGKEAQLEAQSNLETAMDDMRTSKINAATEAARADETKSKASSNAELNSKSALADAQKANAKVKADAIEKSKKAAADSETKSKLYEAKKVTDERNHKTDIVNEKAAKKTVADAEKVTKEKTFKKQETKAATGEEDLVKLDLRRATELAQRAEDDASELQQKINADVLPAGVTPNVLIAKEGTAKERASKLEDTATEVRQKAGEADKRRKVDLAKKDQSEKFDKSDEKKRKSNEQADKTATKDEKVEKLKSLLSSQNEKSDKKVHATKMEYEKKSKADHLAHLKQVRWLKIKADENNSKGEWKNAAATEKKMKKQTFSERAGKGDLQAEEAAEYQAQLQAQEDAKMAAAQEADGKSLAAKKAQADAIEKAEQAAVAKAAADKAVAEAKKAAEAAATKAAAEKAAHELKLAESKAALSKEIDGKTKSAVARAQSNNDEKKAKLVALESEKEVKRVHKEKETAHKKSEANAKEVTSKEEQKDKAHAAEMDVKERRTKKSPYNITYTKNWETDIDVGYKGAYSYRWKNLCVLGGVLTSVGTPTKERSYKKEVMFGTLQSRGIRAHFVGNLGPINTMDQAFQATHKYPNTTTKVWYDKLDLPVPTGSKPWTYLPKEYNKDFAANFTGFLKISKGGPYRFWLTSTGGSELWINNRLIIDNTQDGTHGMKEKEGVTTLEPGPLPFLLPYFTRDPKPGLKLEWEGPGFRRTVLSGEYVGSHEKRALSSRFRGLKNPGFAAQFWADTGMVNNMAQSVINRKTPKDPTGFSPDYRQFELDDIDFSDEKAPFWPGLSDVFEYRFSAKFVANLMISEEGTYTFFLTSIDGSTLKIDDKMVCNNDGLHIKTTVENQVQLARGAPSIEIQYFDNHHGSVLKVEYMGPQTGYKRVLLSGAGKEPAVGQFQKEESTSPSRKLLSEVEVVELGEAGNAPSQPDQGGKNRRRAKWEQDFTWGMPVEGKCQCEPEDEHQILTSMQFHRRRRSSRRRRYQAEGEPADEKMDEMSLLQDSESSMAIEQDPNNDACKCQKMPKKGGWKGEFWSGLTHLSSLTKAVQKAMKAKKTNKIAFVWDLDWKGEGGFWKKKDGSFSLDKTYNKDYVASFEAYMPIKTSGNYAFFMNSDDGAELYVDNTAVIDNDGVHDMQENSGSIKLEADTLARLRVYYFSSLGSPGLQLQVQGPNDEKPKLVDGEMVWNRAIDAESSGASEGEKVRRRANARRRVELNADELRQCGELVSSQGGAKMSEIPPGATVSEISDRLAAVQLAIDELKPQLTEAEKRSQYHPLGSARVQYIALATAMKAKLGSLAADKVTIETELKKAKAANPEEAKDEGIDAAVDTGSPDAANQVTADGICADQTTKVACCAEGKSDGCDRENLMEYARLLNDIATQKKMASDSETSMRGATNKAHIATFETDFKTATKKVEELNNSLSEIISKLNAKDDPPEPPEETIENMISQAQNVVKKVDEAHGNDDSDGDNSAAKQPGATEEPAAKQATKQPSKTGNAVRDDMMNQAANFAAVPDETMLIQVTENFDNEGDVEKWKDHGMSEAEAMVVKTKSAEINVKDKCALKRSEEIQVKDTKLTGEAKAYLAAQTKAESESVHQREQCIVDGKNAQAVERSPSASAALKEEARLTFDKCKKTNTEKSDALEEATLRAKLASGKLKALGQTAAEVDEKSRGIEAQEMKSKSQAKTAERVIKQAVAKKEKAVKTDEMSSKSALVEKVATLPVNCRPKELSKFSAQAKDGFHVTVQVSPQGDVSTLGAQYRFVSLDGIMFAVNPDAADDSEEELGESRKVALNPKKMAEQAAIEKQIFAEKKFNEQAATTSDHYDDFKIMHVFNINEKDEITNELQPLGEESDLGEAADWKPTYVGCYKDDGNRDMAHGPKKYGYDSALKCADDPKCKDMKYVALQNNGWCACDNSYSTPASTYTQQSKADCDKHGEGLGGSWRNAIYDTSSRPSPEEAAVEEKPKNEEGPAVGWNEQKTKVQFNRLQEKYNDPDVWTMCSMEGGVCKDNGKYKMKFGVDGKFRYRHSDGNIPCDDNVFGDFGSNVKKKCYKYTPNVSRRRATGLFKDVNKKGIKADFYNGMGHMSSVGAAWNTAKKRSPSKSMFLKSMVFPEATTYWSQLDSRFEKEFFGVFTGVLMVKETGKYQFYVTADDGAALYIDKQDVTCAGSSCAGTLAIQNDGPKEAECDLKTGEEREACVADKTVVGEATLLKGTAKFQLEYFANSGPHWLEVSWSGQDFSRRPLTDEFIGQEEKFVEDGGNWILSGKEGDAINLKATTDVKFGIPGASADLWAMKTFLAGTIKCDVATFGDPAPGKAKTCWSRLDDSGTHWRECASEEQLCKGFAGNHKVRFGSGDRFAYMETTGDTLCSVDTFGDPAPGFKKYCSVLEVPIKPETPKLSGHDASITDVPEGSDKPYNLALNRPTAQISTSMFGSVAFGGEASRAVDGIKSGAFADKSCTHTFSQMNPWWRVQLAKESTIFAVKIFGRTDKIQNCQSGSAGEGPCGLQKVQVYVSDEPYAGSGSPCLEEASNLDPEGTTVNCHKKSGKYVFVQKNGIESLSLCEVEVIGLVGSGKGVVVDGRPPIKATNPLYEIKLKNGFEAVKYGLPIFAHAEKECPTCKNTLCVLNGEVKMAGGVSPDPDTLVGSLPFMCVPAAKQTFLQANAETGTVWVTVHPDARITASRFINNEESEAPTISFNGIYFISALGGSSKPAAGGQTPDEGYEGFMVKRVGDICMVWGQVGGEIGTLLGTASAECRPTQKLVLHAAASEMKAWISINTAGEAYLQTMGPMGPKYPSVMGGGEEAEVDWDSFIGDKSDKNVTDFSHLHNKTGRYPLWDGKDPALTVDMETTAGKPVGTAPSVELIEEDESDQVKGAKVSISLAGIVYSIADHHVYERTPRPRSLTAAEKNEMKEKAAAAAPKPLSACDLPKLENEGLLHEMKIAKEHIMEDQAAARVLRQRAENAFTDELKSNYTATMNVKFENVKLLSEDRKLIEAKEAKVKYEHKSCFNVTKDDPELTANDMCENWGGIRAEGKPDCCNQVGACTLAQIRDAMAMVQQKGVKLQEDRDNFDKEIADAKGKSYWTVQAKIKAQNQEKSNANNIEWKENKEKQELIKNVQAAVAMAGGKPSL